jgi:fructokinase
LTELPGIIAIGEIIWDLFGDTRRLGGAPLNFAAHVHQLGHPVSLVSSVGDDMLGREAREQIEALGLATNLIETSTRFPTGTAKIAFGPDGEPTFSITRPAAYDVLELSRHAIASLTSLNASWLYFGSLLTATPDGRRGLERLLNRFRNAGRFLDLNLRPGTDAPDLVTTLLGHADVTKLNEAELERVCEITGLPRDIEEFCRAGSELFKWRAVCVTLGARGCAVLMGDRFVEAPGIAVTVADTVGAGDAFAAAFVHGISQHWAPERIAAFANSRGAGVAASPGSLPDSGH